MSVANLLNIKWRDAQGREKTLSYNIKSTYSATSSELLAMIQALQACSQADVVEAHLSLSVDVSGITGSQPTSSGSFDSVEDMVILLWDRDDNTGKIRVSVPAPLDTIFIQTGTYALQDVDASDSLILAVIAAGDTEPVLASPQDGGLTFDKGWRKALPHS